MTVADRTRAVVEERGESSGGFEGLGRGCVRVGEIACWRGEEDDAERGLSERGLSGWGLDERGLSVLLEAAVTHGAEAELLVEGGLQEVAEPGECGRVCCCAGGVCVCCGCCVVGRRGEMTGGGREHATGSL